MIEAGKGSPHSQRRIIMGHTIKFLIVAASAWTLAVSTPAMALNPQPLPPGAHRDAHHLAFAHRILPRCRQGIVYVCQ
jgi:hypothetical protein